MELRARLKGHESFSIREGWLVKGLYNIKNDNKVFSNSEATGILGIGSNMVKSLKYWLYATGLIEDAKKNDIQLTELAELIINYDPYIEDKFTLWLIHYSLTQNVDKAMIWNIFFNKCNAKDFTKKDLLEQIKIELENNNYSFNEKMLLDEINVLIKTYSNDEKIDNPENNFICPLVELKLIKRMDKEKYIKEKANINNLNYLLVYYAILKQLGEEESINIEDLLKCDNSVGKIFNLDKNLINEYLEQLKREKYITINRTAGLNMIYINKSLSLKDLFKLHFEKGV